MFKTYFISSKTREGKKVIELDKHNVDGNKAKGRISKRLFQESKARQIFRKTNISYPLIRTRTCVYQGVRNVRLSENLVCFVFLQHPFWDSPFCLITDDVWFLDFESYYSFGCVIVELGRNFHVKIWMVKTIDTLAVKQNCFYCWHFDHWNYPV